MIKIGDVCISLLYVEAMVSILSKAKKSQKPVKITLPPKKNELHVFVN